MRKRIFSLTLLLALTMLLGLLPTAAFALEAEPAHSHDGWTAVTMGESCIKLGGEEQSSNTLHNGCYYLDADVNVSLIVTGEVSLCLNGHSVTVSGGHAVTVSSGASLTLWDCAAGSTGKLAYTGTSSSYYGIYNQGTLTLHSGAVEGYYCGVTNYSTSTFTMTGGSVTATGSSGRGVYNSSSRSVFRLSGGSVSGGQYGILNEYSGSTVYLSGEPSVSGTTADIYTADSPSKIYADDGADTPTPYSGNVIKLAYSSPGDGYTAVYHVTEGNKDKFTLPDSYSDKYELKFSEEDNALQFQGKPQALTWYGIDDQLLTGEGYPASLPYGAYLRTSKLPNPPSVEGKIFLGWLYKKGDVSDWSTRYWSGDSIRSATAFKADYMDGFPGGSGTESDPYQIADANHLQTLAALVSKDITAYNNSDVWYKLTDNIDLSTVCGEGNDWTPIGGENYYAFEANLDGNGKTVSNLYINTDRSYQGLFYRLYGATVKNLTLTGWVTAVSDYGALAGTIENSVVENVDVTGVTLTPYGYTPDGNRIMAYKVDDDNTIHIQGNYKNNWVQTTYNREGYAVATADLTGATVSVSAEFINGGRYVQLSYTVTAGETAIEGGKLAVHADVQIGDNDSAAVEVIQDAAGEVIGLKMVDTHSNKSGCLSQDAQFNLYFDGTGGVTPVDTYWFGFYGERTNINSTYGRIYFAPLNDDTKSRDRTYEQDASGVYTKLTGTDSGFAVSWQNISLDAGESKTYSFILGVGEKADPPQWSDGNAVTLTLAADAEQNKRLVNVSARVKDAAGLTDTLYYSVDGGEGEILGEVAADGSMKAITGQLELSGYAEGSYLFSFWVVNSKGAASASVERTITITADGIEGLDGDAPAHEHAWATAWSKDANGHWHACTAQGCGITDYANCGEAGAAYAAHVYDDDQDATCNTCGYNRADTPPTPDQGEVKGEVERKPGAPAVTVDEETLKDLAGEVQEGESVTVKLTVEKQDDPADKAELEEIVQGKKDDVLYLDLSLLKTTVRGDGGSATETVNDTGDKVLEIAVPYDFAGKKDVTAYRKHGENAAEVLAALSERPTGNFADGSFFADSEGGMVYIYTSKFSTYAIGYTAESSEEPGTSSGGSDNYYTLTATAGEGGSISPKGKVTVQQGLRKTFTITPDEGYEIADVLVDGESVGAVESYVFRQVSRRHTIEAVFQRAGDKKEERPAWNPFEDVKAGDWFHDDVRYVYERGLMVGTDESHFRPEWDTSRAMIAVILWRMEGSPGVKTGADYPDCVADSWYAQAVAWASESGVVKGYDNGSFGPEDPITREQLAVMLWRYAGSPKAKGGLSTFTDAGQAGFWAVDALDWAVEAGILRGKDGGRLDPTGLASRAEAAAMLTRYPESGK